MKGASEHQQGAGEKHLTRNNLKNQTVIFKNPLSEKTLKILIAIKVESMSFSYEWLSENCIVLEGQRA